jgi:hypothetical protein
MRVGISNQNSNWFEIVIAGHSRPKDGVASARLCPAIHPLRNNLSRRRWMPGSSPGMTSVFAGTPTNFKQPVWPAATPSRSRRACARVLATTSPSLKSEGAGNAGRSLRPQPCVRNEKAHKHSHHGHTGITRHSPRNGFNGFLRALLGDRAFLPPSPAKVASRRLDTSVGASGPHDFAVRGPTSFVADIARVHRIPHPTS